MEEAAESSERPEDIAFWRQIDLCQLESEIVMPLEQDDPALFHRCRQISLIYPDFIDPVIEQFSLDFPFYAGYIELMQKMLAEGFYFTYPMISSDQPIDMTALYHIVFGLTGRSGISCGRQ